YQVVYHLEESGFPYFDSTLGWPSTNGVAPVVTNGIVGNGQYMAGTPYLDVGKITLSNQFTLNAWLNLTNPNDIQCVWANKVGGYTSAGFGLYINSYQTSDGAIRMETGNGSAGIDAYTTGGAISNGWHMLTAVVDTVSGNARFYVDGNSAVMTRTTIRTDMPLTNDMRLGRFDDLSYPFHGTMDEARIRNGTN